MIIKNFMEKVVRTEVSRHKASRENRKACWCPLCEADIISLTLTYLPPLYCMEHSYGLVNKKIPPVKLRTAIKRAVSRVSFQPKHHSRSFERLPKNIRIVNLAYEEGKLILKAIVASPSVPCKCDQCQADILALALNRINPQYGLECDGRTRFTDVQREFLRHDLGLILQKAAQQVASYPHH